MFLESVIEKIGYYVYFLRNPITKEVFYVGKGKGNRVFEHVNCALVTEEKSDKLDLIREINKSGFEVEHMILRHGLDEISAFDVESSIIDFIGLNNLSNIQDGRYSSDFGIKTTKEIISIYDAKKLETNLPIVLININRKYRRDMTPTELYEATRKAWLIGGRREKAFYAVATYRGLTREAYKIDSWYDLDDGGKQRWAFNGSQANDDIRQELIYKSIVDYFSRGAANPIKYVNC